MRLGKWTAAALMASLCMAGSAQAATVTIGSPLSTVFAPSEITSSSTLFNSALPEPGAHLTSPIDGAIVRWRLFAAQGGPFALRVLRPAGSGAYTAVGTSAAVTPTSLSGEVINANLTVRAGDTIGIDAPKGSRIGGATVGGAALSGWKPALADAATLATNVAQPGVELSFNADVQPPPTIASISPASGFVRGGTVVKILGADFAGLTAVHFGAKLSTSTSTDGAGEILAVAPPGKLGAAADVTVTTVAGTSPVSAVASFNSTACVVPKLKGRKLKSAKRRIRKAGCKLRRVGRRRDARANLGRVVAQSHNPGQKVPLGTKLTIVLG